MSALERLLAEAIPDGTFGGSRLAGAPSRARREVTPAEAARHYAALVAAVAELEHRGTGDAQPEHRPARHLHAVPETTKDAA